MKGNRHMDFSDNEMLRKLQLTEFEMLVEFDRICRKHNINYSLDAGTLLGAVRHKGFIPWDNDVDVMMTREEYERFFEKCQTELDTDSFFLQEFRTDHGYRWGYSKLRRNGTLFLREGQEDLNCHHGVFVDIFIIDNVPDGYFSRRVHHVFCYIIRKGLYSVVGCKSAENMVKRFIYKLASFIPISFWKNALKKAQKAAKGKRTQLISRLTFPYGNQIKYGLSSDYYDEYTELEFEGKQFMVVKEYDRYLRELYGDYMILPPVEQRKGHSALKIELLD